MNAKKLLFVSLTVNAILLGVLAILSSALSEAPKLTTPLVRFVFTNAPTPTMDAAGREQLGQWQMEMEADRAR